MQTSIERKWLIKSDSKILGPYTFEQIEELIKKKQITLIDEVRDMNTRWNYIRETQDLKPIVENIRIELASSEDMTKTIQTKTHQTGTNSGTQTLTITKTEELASSERTPPGVQSASQLEVAAALSDKQIQDVAFTEVETLTTDTIKETTQKINPKKQYVFEADPVVQKNIKKSNRLLYFSIALAFVVGLIAVGGGYYYKINSQKKHELNLISQIKRYYILGLDNYIIDTYTKMLPESQKIVLSEIIPIIPKLDSAGLINGSAIINELKADTKLNDSKKALLEVIGLHQSIQEQNLKEAREALIRAKGYDPMNDYIKEDEAILDYLDGDFAKASELFLELYKKNDKGRLLFGHILSDLAANNEKTHEELTKLSFEIDRFVAVKVDYKKPLLLLSMYINKKIGKESDFNDSFKKYIATPAGLQNLFKVPYSVYGNFYSFTLTKDYLEKLKSYLTVDQKFIVDYLANIEIGDLTTAQNLFSTYQSTIASKELKIDLQVQLLSAQKNFDALIALEKTLTPEMALNYASHYSLLNAKKRKGLSISEMSHHVEFLKTSKSILSLWAELQLIDQKNSQESFVQMNSVLYDDFIPFQEIKGHID
ncbi:MAG: hypothetical protein ACK4VO_09160 [Pseudobdellovibrio sp.]